MAKVSVQMLLRPSSCPSTEVRLMSWSPDAHRPSTYQGVSVPSEYVPRMSMPIQVPAGVWAFQEAMTSVAGTVSRWTGEVQVAYSQVAVRPVCGSVWSSVPSGVPTTTPGRSPALARVPSWLPERQSV